MERARVIPVSGISNDREAEQRATSALLAVLTVVRDLSDDLLTPLGASRAQKATVEAFTEVTFKSNGKTFRPDGLIRVSFGKNVWTAFVEVKTGTNTLDTDQINSYWDIARAEKYDHVITISNEIPASPGTHPVAGLKVRATSPVKVSHLSWTMILTEAIKIKQHRGVDDPEQAWLLNELIRYLEHPASGALAFDDMGPNWVEVRDASRTSTVSPKSESASDIASRFDQLIRYLALMLGSQIGEDVSPFVPKAQREASARLKHLVDSLCRDGVVTGGLKVPNTAGDIDLTADIRAQTITMSTSITAPTDRGGRARGTWLNSQLAAAPDRLRIESYARGARSPVACSLAELREDRNAALGDAKIEPVRFVLSLSSPMGKGRKTATKQASFIDSIARLLGEFYESTLQGIKPWHPTAPKIQRPTQDEPAANLPVISEPSLYERYWPSAGEGS